MMSLIRRALIMFCSLTGEIEFMMTMTAVRMEVPQERVGGTSTRPMYILGV